MFCVIRVYRRHHFDVLYLPSSSCNREGNTSLAIGGMVIQNI